MFRNLSFLLIALFICNPVMASKITSSVNQCMGTTCSPQLSALGLGAAANTSNGLLNVSKSSTPVGFLESAIYSAWSFPASSTLVNAGLYSTTTDTGSNVNSGGHYIALFGRSFDNPNTLVATYGTEGRIDLSGATNGGAGIFGIANWQDTNSGNTTVRNGTLVGMTTQAGQFNFDGITPRTLQGNVIGLDVGTNYGGLNNYGVYIADQNSGTVNIGMVIGADSQASLWLNNDSNSTTPAGGIVVGSSLDTNLYRSAAKQWTMDAPSLGTTQTAGLVLSDTTTGSINLPPSIYFVGNAYNGGDYPVTWKMGGGNVLGIGADFELFASVPAAASSVEVFDCSYTGTCQFNNLTISGLTTNTLVYSNGSSGLASGTVSTGLLLSSGTLTSNAQSTLHYESSALTSVVATKDNFTKIVKASTVDNIVASAYTFTCTTNPTISLFECGTSTTCASSPTTIATVTLTTTGTVVAGTVSNAAITAGDYIAWGLTAGACTVLNMTANAQVHSN